MTIIRLLEDLDLIIGVNAPIPSGSPIHKSIKKELAKAKNAIHKPIGKMKGKKK